MIRLLVLTAAILLLTACAGAPGPERVQTVPVKEAVPVPCKVNLGPQPDYHDSDAELARVPFPEAEAALLKNPMDFVAIEKMAQNLLYAVKHLRAGRNLRAAREVQKDVALAKCQGT